MKIVDEKGRLFGKINIVDLFVILLVVVVAVVALLSLRGGTDGEGAVTLPTLTYTVRVAEVDPATYENVCQFVDRAAGKQDQLMASGMLVDGYVVDVSAEEHIPTAGDTVGGKTLDLTFTIEARTADSMNCTVGTQEVRIGKDHIVKTVHLEFPDGVILTCDRES